MTFLLRTKFRRVLSIYYASSRYPFDIIELDQSTKKSGDSMIERVSGTRKMQEATGFSQPRSAK